MARIRFSLSSSALPIADVVCVGRLAVLEDVCVPTAGVMVSSHILPLWSIMRPAVAAGAGSCGAFPVGATCRKHTRYCFFRVAKGLVRIGLRASSVLCVVKQDGLRNALFRKKTLRGFCLTVFHERVRKGGARKIGHKTYRGETEWISVGRCRVS